MLGGQTTDDIARKLRHDIFQGQLARNVSALVRTSVASVSDQARSLLYEQNDDVISEVMQHSTLDSRTTPICMAYSGKRWSLPDYEPVGHDLPYNNGVPRHWGCRSTIVPVVAAFSEMGGGSPSSARAERIFRKKAREAGLKSSEVDRAMRHAQASMDGYVPESLDYEAWLETKPVEFQKEMLGPSKYALWNAGKISFSDLVDQSGDPLTVEELRKRAS